MPATTHITLIEDEVDDLLYSARAGELAALQEDISTLTNRHNGSSLDIVCAAIDPHTGNTLAHYACANGHEEIMKYIISLGSNTSSTTTSTTSSESPTLPPELLSYLVRPNDSMSTPLHYAALNDQLASIRLLLDAIPVEQKSSLVGAKNASGRDAAYEAESAGKEDVVTFLLGIMDEAELQPTGDDDETMEDGENAGEEGGIKVDETTDVEQTTTQVENMKVDD